ncbi:MAG: 3-phenylpropionate/cinnamic acid dioxygenase small subunit [Gammaproteobacteria bacterium]|jgi:3-phenylpropionate/cinnamic acid dioxygenase small subunit
MRRDELLAQGTQLLAREAMYLDMRRWDDWLALYAENTVFWAPAWRNDDEMISDTNREISLFYFDSRAALADRVWRIGTGRAPALTPLPRTTHLVSNPLLADDADASTLTIYSAWTCNVYSLRDKSQHSFFGRYEHTFSDGSDGWRIVRKKIILMNDYIPVAIEFFCV